MANFSKEKLLKIEIYDEKEHFIGTSKLFTFAKQGLFNKSTTGITIKANNLTSLKKGASVKMVFEYLNGSRFKGICRVDSVSRTEVTIFVGAVEELVERRRSFKVNTKEKATLYRSKKDEKGLDATILNINLGGVLVSCEEALTQGSEWYINTLNGELELLMKVLRVQKNEIGKIIGYGCQFLDISQQDEDTVAKYIFECQVAERERSKSLEDIGLA